MEHGLRMTAEDFVALTVPESVYSDGEMMREAARAVQNGHAESVECRIEGDSAHLTSVYSLANNTWTFDVVYPVHVEKDPGDACRPDHSFLRNVYIDTPLPTMFLADSLTFVNCVFGTGIRFDDVREFHAVNCIFLEPFEAVGDKVLNNAEFTRCIFKSKFVMGTGTVSGGMDFNRNTFLAEFSLNNINVGGDLTLAHNRFHRLISVMQCTLSGLFLFSGNRCTLFLMDRCTLNNGSNMDECSFSEQFMLINSRLNADASFNHVTLPYADLSSNYFSTLTVWDCTCDDTISFIDSRFENDVVFNRVRSPKIDFIKTKITSMVKIDNVPAEYGRYGPDDGRVQDICVDLLDFRDATVMGYLVVKNCFGSIDLKDTRINGGIDLDWDYLNVYDGHILKRFRKDCRVRNAESDTMMTLYEAMVNNKKYTDAENYYQAYMLLRRFEPKHGRVPRFPIMSYLHELISGFGRRPFRLFVFVVFLILTFGMAYFALGLGSVQDSIYFSGITFFTIGFTEVGVMDFAVKVLAIAEGFSGVFSMSYLVASLTRKNI